MYEITIIKQAHPPHRAGVWSFEEAAEQANYGFAYALERDGAVRFEVKALDKGTVVVVPAEAADASDLVAWGRWLHRAEPGFVQRAARELAASFAVGAKRSDPVLLDLAQLVLGLTSPAR